ncbi:MAG: uncharacterized protein KVP18_004217 [Porospora cf. gigantea A]|uniref:uncharacterized protein n=1 Tax=Porospora cf. gigantea A TaxID=2853593 RepID=UPI003559DFDE|nr:MAG: hypothetical protein KVP18_004217 [Porospora cf. gigantea A]
MADSRGGNTLLAAYEGVSVTVTPVSELDSGALSQASDTSWCSMSDATSDAGSATETEFSDTGWYWGDQEYDNTDFERLIASRARRASISTSGDFTSLREVVPSIRQLKDKQKLSAIPDSRLMREALEDCYMRFVAGMPPNFSRTLHFYFQLQKAFFFYDDFWVDNHKSELPRLSFRAFGTLLTVTALRL